MKPLPRLREQRKQRGLTQKELATLSGVSRHAIATLETNRDRAARNSTLLKLARALKVRPKDLL